MTLIDTHTHLYLEQFDNDRGAIMNRARAAGVEKFYLPGIDSEVIDRMLKMEQEYPDCRLMAGLHPCSVNANFQAELQIVESWLGKRPFAAIGEIGLDFHWDETFASQQYEAFRIQIEWALQYDLPIVIHTRRAMQSTIEVVKEYSGRGLRGIFHCFGGSYQEAKEIIDCGFLLGIGGVVTYKKSGLDDTLAKVSLEHLVLETDAPYLTPVPHRGKRNESSYLSFVVARLAEVYNVSAEEIAESTTAQARKIFSEG